MITACFDLTQNYEVQSVIAIIKKVVCSPHQIIRDLVACIGVIVTGIVFPAVVKDDNGPLVPLHDFPRDTLCNNLVSVVHKHNCQPAT